MLPAAILQELVSLAKQDMLRFELDPKPTLAFQVKTCNETGQRLLCGMQTAA